jgi:hypothetical protein
MLTIPNRRARSFALLSSLCVVALCACHGKERAPTALPSEWPVKQLTLPDDAQVFEGHIDTQHGGTAVTVFYTAGADWDAQVLHVESKLGPLHYRAMPEPADADTAVEEAPLNHQAWCSPEGDKVVFLSEDKAPQDKAGGAGTYFTLLGKALNEPIAVDPAWPVLSK